VDDAHWERFTRAERERHEKLMRPLIDQYFSVPPRSRNPLLKKLLEQHEAEYRDSILKNWEYRRAWLEAQGRVYVTPFEVERLRRQEENA